MRSVMDFGRPRCKKNFMECFIKVVEERGEHEWREFNDAIVVRRFRWRM